MFITPGGGGPCRHDRRPCQIGQIGQVALWEGAVDKSALSQVEAQRKDGGVLDISPEFIKAIWRVAIWAVRVEMATAAWTVQSYLQVQRAGQLSSREQRDGSWRLEASCLLYVPTRHGTKRCCRGRLDGGVVSEWVELGPWGTGRSAKTMPAILGCCHQSCGVGERRRRIGVCWLNGQRMERRVVV